jgi:integrase
VNPATLVEPPPLELTEVQPLSVNEARELLAAADTSDLAARWVLGLSLGLRQGEVLGLHWEDLDLTHATLRVRRALQRRSDGRLVEVAPKTARSRRALPLPASVVTALLEHQANQESRRQAAGPSWTETGLVFTTRRGTPIHPRNDYRAFVALLSAAGLRRVRLHDLRHTTASLLLTQGVSPRVVMEILGHSQISVTMNTYSHVSPELNRAAAEGMQQALWPAEGES